MNSQYRTNQNKFMEEMCIVVNERDRQIGIDTKKNCHLINKVDGSTICHRAFSVFLFDEKKRLLLQRRSIHKITFPLYWANTCCSHPLNILGETDTDDNIGVKFAAIRKLNHELGIDLDCFTTDDFTNVLTVKYNAHSDEIWGENEIDHVIVAIKDVPFVINEEEVCEARYFTYDEVIELLDNKNADADLVSPWFEKISRYYLKTIFDHLDDLKSIVKNDVIVF